MDSFISAVTGMERATRTSDRFTDLGSKQGIFLPIFKEENFACRTLKSKGYYRVCYAMSPPYAMFLIEVYNKGSQEHPNLDLIKKNMKGLKPPCTFVDGPWIEIKCGSCRNLYLNDDSNGF